MKIWVYLNGNQQGPYTLDELRQLNLTSSTPVWYEGLSQWMPAREAPATASLFCSEPVTEPVFSGSEVKMSLMDDRQPVAGARADMLPAPPTFIGWSVFLMICCFPIGGLLGIIFSVMSGNAYRAGDYTRASRLSESAEWCVIISIVLGLITAPLMIALF